MLKTTQWNSWLIIGYLISNRQIYADLFNLPIITDTQSQYRQSTQNNWWKFTNNLDSHQLARKTSSARGQGACQTEKRYVHKILCTYIVITSIQLVLYKYTQAIVYTLLLNARIHLNIQIIHTSKSRLILHSRYILPRKQKLWTDLILCRERYFLKIIITTFNKHIVIDKSTPLDSVHNFLLWHLINSSSTNNSSHHTYDFSFQLYTGCPIHNPNY